MSSTSACPYAVALDDETTASHGSQGSLLGNTSPQTLKLMCPAFQGTACPFKDAKSSEQIRETMRKMPDSHLAPEGLVIKLLHTLHETATHLPRNDQRFQLPEGCPVMTSRALQKHHRSFSEALEEHSLSVVLARALEKKEDVLEVDAPSKNVSPRDKSVSTSLPRVPSLSSNLSESLKTGTAVSHQAAEDVHFVKNFIQGKIDRNLFANLVGMLYHVYFALEDSLNQHAIKHFATCHFPSELNRVEALHEDLDFWMGSDSSGNPVIPEMSPATKDYVDRIQHIADSDPLLLLSHSYTRYLGDLSGGRILARVARQAMGLGKGKGGGLDFYEFENIISPKVFKEHYREALDALELTSEQVTRLVAEANVAFVLNMRLFEELDVQANVPGAAVRPVEEAFQYANQVEQHQQNYTSSSNECPFLVQKKQQRESSATMTGRCPWPFIFMHDPAQGIQDWQTWLVTGLVLCWVWQRMQG